MKFSLRYEKSLLVGLHSTGGEGEWDLLYLGHHVGVLRAFVFRTIEEILSFGFDILPFILFLLVYNQQTMKKCEKATEFL